MSGNKNQHRTIVGTNIDEVKSLNANSGLSYNQVKELVARTTGGHGTAIFSDTDTEEVKTTNQPSLNHK